MRTPRGVSILEPTILICLVTVASVWGVSALSDEFRQPFTRTSHALAIADAPGANSVSGESSVMHAASLSSYVTLLAGFLVVLALALAYKWLRPAGEGDSHSIKQTVLRQLKTQIKKDGRRRGTKLLEKRERIYQAFSSKWSKGIDGAIQARDIMSGSLKCVTPDLSRARVAREMKTAGVHHLLVCNVDGKLAGIISDRDMQKEDCQLARDLMTADPCTVQVDDEIDRVITLMITKHISCVPVMMGQTLIGVISSSDIAVTLQCTMSLLADIFSNASRPHLAQLEDAA
ncbi:MAG: CBS domain-containing protein [Pirellulaceae bacterium]